jgi:acyl carrier protein
MSDVEIIYQSVDVSDREALQNALMTVQTDRPPLRGLFHCAGVRDDGLISNYDANRLEKVLSGKAVGAWNLHTLTLGLDLDLFILFSSVASIVGTAGQGGYAAANACLDALAAMRRSKGLPGLCINWGPWANAGMADDDHASDRLKRQGFHMIRPKEACDLLDQMLHYSIDQICVMPLDGEEPRIIKDNPLFNNTSDQLESFMGLTAVAYTVSYLKGLVPEQKKALVCRSIREAVSQIMELDGATITMKESWRSLGVDSLMSVELRQHIESRLHVSIPVTDFQSSKSISLTVAWIIDQWDQSII